MSFKYGNVTRLDPERIATHASTALTTQWRKPSGTHSRGPGMPQGRGAPHPEYPLERVCSHRSEAFQLTFARNAKQHLSTREDVEVVVSHRGLSIRAETEDAIDAAIVVLKDLYGTKIRIGPPIIRLHEGVSLEQPWMGLRVRCERDHLDAVNADLIRRNATIVCCEIEAASCLIQATAPLSNLMGYRTTLEKITANSAQHAVWLSHYAPLDRHPPDGHAA
jgi:hypothetical protein